MSNLSAKPQVQVVEVKGEGAGVAAVVAKERKFVLLHSEIDEDELKDLKVKFDCYEFNSKSDYKINAVELLKDCEMLLIDANDKDALFYYADMKSCLETCEYQLHTIYKAKKGHKLDVQKLKATFGVDKIIKYIPENFIKNKEEYVRRMLVDHMSETDGCGLLKCLFKKND